MHAQKQRAEEAVHLDSLGNLRWLLLPDSLSLSCEAALDGVHLSTPLTSHHVAQTGKQLAEKAVHTDSIGDLQMANDCSHFVTASKDKTAKLVDAQTLEVMKTYATEYPVNTATISPIEDHVRSCALSLSCLVY